MQFHAPTLALVAQHRIDSYRAEEVLTTDQLGQLEILRHDVRAAQCARHYVRRAVVGCLTVLGPPNQLRGFLALLEFITLEFTTLPVQDVA